jgi:hypothetical protein
MFDFQKTPTHGYIAKDVPKEILCITILIKIRYINPKVLLKVCNCNGCTIRHIAFAMFQAYSE